MAEAEGWSARSRISSVLKGALSTAARPQESAEALGDVSHVAGASMGGDLAPMGIMPRPF